MWRVVTALVLTLSLVLVMAAPAMAGDVLATFTPLSGPVGTTITVTGTGWTGNETITGVGNVTVGSANATYSLTVLNGNLTGTITVPAVTGGLKDIVITGNVTTKTSSDAFTVTAAATGFSPITGPVGHVIRVNGTGWVASEGITATVGGETAEDTLTVDGDGALTGNITVPAVTGGLKAIVITGTASGPVNSPSAFTVTAAATGFTPATGPVGTVIAVTGTGWVASEAITATVGNVTAEDTLTVNASGALTGNITAVPALAGGAKAIVITGATTAPVTFGNFTVTAAATAFTPATGPVGTVIAVTGTGWVESEAITATVGNVTAEDTLTVAASGNLTGTITVPAGLAIGAKAIVVTGNVTTAKTFGNFTVTAAATFNPVSGPVGQVIAVTGTGWTGNETIAGAGNVTVGGGNATAYTLTVASGNLTGNITVPAVALGLKAIVITGSLSGAQTFTGAFTVTTTAAAAFIPITGPVGTVIAVTGTGWVESEAITATVGNVTAEDTLTVAASGNLTGTITVPTLAGGLQTIVITGATSGNQTFAGAFTVTTATAIFNPATGPVGTVITVTGTGWAGNDTITAVTVGNITATSTHHLTVNAVGALTGNITVPTALDTLGLKDIVITGATSGAQTFEDAFTVTTLTTIALQEGWNFISVPNRMAAAKDTFGELLTGISYTIAWSYNAATGLFVQIGNSTSVAPLEGYWINVTTAGNITLSYAQGLTVPPSRELKGQAWNAIGHSSTGNQTAEKTLLSIADSWSTLIGWKAATQTYDETIFAPGTSDQMIPGKGYWIWMTQDDTLSAISGSG